VKFQVLTVVGIKMTVFWDVKKRSVEVLAASIIRVLKSSSHRRE
jgi:hypothetical protein